MSDIHNTDLRLLDASLLMVFLGCMRHRKATAVANEMGLTQPAVSHALKRLRNLYGDPLFLRRAHGLEPTALAHELEPQIRQVVRLLATTFKDQQEFDPCTATTTLNIGAFDHELTTILPNLIARLRSAGPGMALQTFSVTNRDALDALVDARIDIAIGFFDFPLSSAANFVADELCTEHYVIAARRDHPLLCGHTSVDAYAAAKHLLISPVGFAKNMVDHALQLQGLTRKIEVTVPSLFASLAIVEKSDLLVTLPLRVAEANAQRFNLGYSELPFEAGDFKLHAVRHVRDAKSPLHLWFVEQLKVSMGLASSN